jgi:tripartite-type tricarboxylate transporter receptor subunit TctC
MKALASVVVLFLYAACGVAYAAQDGYPSRPIRLVSPFPPGGFNDILSRLVGQKLTESWAQQVVVDNRPGANMIIGTALVAKSPPDGYTMVMAAIPHAINPGLYKLPYDPVKDFTPIVMICSVPNLLVVHPSVPVNSVKELLAYAKANPGKISFASPESHRRDRYGACAVQRRGPGPDRSGRRPGRPLHRYDRFRGASRTLGPATRAWGYECQAPSVAR